MSNPSNIYIHDGVAVKKPAGYKPLPTDSNIEDNAVGELGDASTPAAANTSESLAKAAAAAKAKKAKLMAATAALSKNKGKPVGGQSFSPLLEKYEPRRSLAGCCAHKFTITLTFAVYVIGFASLFMYAKFLAENSPTMTFKQTTLPVILHIVGVGGCALLKSYYDFSSDVGYFEAMTLIIRSRMWLFPGVLGETTRVKREDVEEERRQQVSQLEKRERRLAKKYGALGARKIAKTDKQDKKDKAEDAPDPVESLKRFKMLSYLSRAQYPEFRCLFRGLERFPWARVPKFADSEKADIITIIAQDEIRTIFPVLAVIDVFSNVGKLINPCQWLRLFARVRESRSRVVCTPDDLQEPGKVVFVTRSEEFEESTYPKDFLPLHDRTEPLPWGTLRLGESPELIGAMRTQVRLVGFVIFALSLFAYATIITGEFNFMDTLAGMETLTVEDVDANATAAIDAMSPDEVEAWMSAYHAMAPQVKLYRFLLFMLIPFSIQASALLAENAIMPMLIVGTLKAHITNFVKELDEYFTVLALNNGILEDHHPPKKNRSRNAMEEKYRLRKIAMARNMAISWRMDKFFKEIENDSQFINLSVAVLCINFGCHLVMLSDAIAAADSCVPVWMMIFFFSNLYMIHFILTAGVECNEIIDGQIDSLLHEWQLKFLMIGWSGGFVDNGNNAIGPGGLKEPPPLMATAAVVPPQGEGGNDGIGIGGNGGGLRPGWTRLDDQDAFSGENAHEEGLHSDPVNDEELGKCQQLAEKKGYGGFVIYQGRAYFRHQTPDLLLTGVSPSTGSILHVAPMGTPLDESTAISSSTTNATATKATVTAVVAVPSRHQSRIDDGSSSSGDATVFTDAESAATGEVNNGGEVMSKEKAQELQEAAKVAEANAAAATVKSQAASKKTEEASKAVGGLLGKSIGKAKAASSAVGSKKKDLSGLKKKMFSKKKGGKGQFYDGSDSSDYSSDEEPLDEKAKAERNDDMDKNDECMIAYLAEDPQTAEQREKEEDASQDPNPIKAIMHALEANAKAAEDKERVASIVAVLAHYEAGTTQPFSIFGVTLTTDLVTMVIGFFSAPIAGLMTSILVTLATDQESLSPKLMCHGFAI